MVLTLLLLLSCNTKMLLANNDPDGMNQETTQNNNVEIEGNGKEIENLVEPIMPTAVGDTIAITFPDTAFAQVIADKVAGGDVNAILTQPMIDGLLTLDAGNKGIQDITGVEVLSSLLFLYLRGNQITSVPDSIGNLTTLTHLDLSNNQLTIVPEAVGNLINLYELDLQENELTSIPTGIGNLINLHTLVADDNLIVSLPESIGNLNKLQSLGLTTNKLTSLPASIGGLTSLREMWLSVNQIASIPDSIGGLVSLEHLDLTWNKLTNVPESIGNLSGLQTLWLGTNNITSIPESIGGLSSLWYLALNGNQLTNIPTSIGSLSNLENLDLSSNSLISLSENVGNLSSLQNLWIEYNQMTSLPDNIGNLSGLQAFSMGNNLLPTDYEVTLNTLGLNISINYEEQRQLTLQTGLEPYKITSESDLNSINLLDAVLLNDGSDVLSAHELILENYVDENDNPVDINDYIQNGNVIKLGTVFVQVRATGTGLFPNNSDHAITMDRIQLDFGEPIISYSLSFDLNGGEGVAPKTQALAEGEMGVAVDNPTRTGFTFIGWNTKPNGTGDNWIVGKTPMIAGNVVLYAKWEENAKPVPPNKNAKSLLPQTGDTNNVLLLSIVLLLSSVALIVISKKRKNR